VGTGIAGLIAAHRASRHHEIILVTKAQLIESNTKYAQGGIAAALFPDDSVASHVEDTLVAGAGLSDRAAVDVLCGEGPERVRELIRLGVDFDRDGTGPDAEFARGHEAAHSHRRVIHAGGDATGLAIEVALLRAVRNLALEVHEHTFLRDLVVADDVDGHPRVAGVDLIGPDGEPFVIAADVVILATGGAGQLFRHTTNPAVTTGDGIAAAFRAGAAVQDLEFYQFHPTALAVPGTPLVSEAVRGEGAVLLDEDGRRFMLDAHPDAELAPRDVVARGIAAAMARQGGRPVMLDATALGGDFLAQRFPGITRVLTQHGLDWAREPIPVTPAAHYWMGGIRTDIDGRTTLPGLYAVGEASCTGVHGANRLASNSLLESLVFAWRAADALDGEQFPLDLQGVIGVPPAQSAPIGVATRQFVRDDFQELMWTRVGLERDAEGLRAAIHELDSLQVEGEQVDDYEDRALLELGRLVARAALAREESRGAHSRRDFPDTIETYAHPIRWRLSSPVPSELSLSDAELLDRDPLLTGPITTTGFSVGLRAEAAS